MYTVETRIFGKYVNVGYRHDYGSAMILAEEQRGEGWLYVRIISPDGSVDNL